MWMREALRSVGYVGGTKFQVNRLTSSTENYTITTNILSVKAIKKKCCYSPIEERSLFLREEQVKVLKK